MVRLQLSLLTAGLFAFFVPSTAIAADEPSPAAGSEHAALPPAKAADVTQPPKASTKGQTTLLIDIDLTHQRMTVSEHGQEVGNWPISSGAAGHRSPTGTFRPLWLARMWYSKKYDNAPMPHAVFFSGGVAMHATYATGMLGRPASHGCIRQSPASAAITYNLVEKHGNEHTRIVVHGAPRDDETRVARPSSSGDSERRLASRSTERSYQPARRAQVAATVGMRRVILVDGYGKRRISEIPANDPRLVAYYQRRSSGLD